MKSRSNLVTLLVVLAFTATACGGTATSSAPGAGTAAPPSTEASASAAGGEAVTLKLQHSEPATTPAGIALKAALDAFKKEFPNITVEQNVVAILDSPEVYETALLAGQPPDIIWINLFGRPLEWLNQEATLPVTAQMDEWGLRARVSDLAVTDYTHANGQLQGFPYLGFKWPVWYNKAELTKAGVTDLPQSTDDLIATTNALTKAGLGGVAVGGSDWSGNKLFWQVLQAYLANETAIKLFRDGDFSSPEVRKGIDLFVALRDAGVFVKSVEGLTADQMAAQFFAGEAAIMPSGSWAFGGTPAALVDSVELGGFPNPSDGLRDKPTAYAGFTSSGWWLSPTASEKMDAVHKFVEFMYRPETAALFVEQGLITAVEDVPVEAGALSPLLVSAMTDLDARVDYVVLPDVYIPTAVLTATERVTSLAYTRGTSADDIVAGLVAAYANQ
jgi:multiple sugar transport system substrate-binding protein